MNGLLPENDCPGRIVFAPPLFSLVPGLSVSVALELKEATERILI